MGSPFLFHLNRTPLFGRLAEYRRGNQAKPSWMVSKEGAAAVGRAAITDENAPQQLVSREVRMRNMLADARRLNEFKLHIVTGNEPVHAAPEDKTIPFTGAWHGEQPGGEAPAEPEQPRPAADTEEHQ